MKRVLTFAWSFAIPAGGVAIVAFPQAVELLLALVCVFLLLAGVPAFFLAARGGGGRA